VLELQEYFIKEHAGVFKLSDTYDILDPDTKEVVGVATEIVSGLSKVLRLFLSKKLMPTKVEIREEPDGSLVFYLRKPVSLFKERVEVYDARGQMIGYFKSKLFSFGGGFYVYDANDNQFAEVKGKWTGWDFSFVTPEGDLLGKVTKKFAGVLKEMFTSADNYLVTIDDSVADQPAAKMLLLGAALAIDMVYYEQGN
jgi:uncharacterized protein YxjI